MKRVLCLIIFVFLILFIIPLPKIEPVYCIQVVGAQCPSHKIVWSAPILTRLLSPKPPLVPSPSPTPASSVPTPPSSSPTTTGNAKEVNGIHFSVENNFIIPKLYFVSTFGNETVLDTIPFSTSQDPHQLISNAQYAWSHDRNLFGLIVNNELSIYTLKVTSTTKDVYPAGQYSYDQLQATKLVSLTSPITPNYFLFSGDNKILYLIVKNPTSDTNNQLSINWYGISLTSKIIQPLATNLQLAGQSEYLLINALPNDSGLISFTKLNSKINLHIVKNQTAISTIEIELDSGDYPNKIDLSPDRQHLSLNTGSSGGRWCKILNLTTQKLVLDYPANSRCLKWVSNDEIIISRLAYDTLYTQTVLLNLKTRNTEVLKTSTPTGVYDF